MSSPRSFAVPFACLLAPLLFALASESPAQEFPLPGKPIRIVVPFPAGGQADTLSRAMGLRLGESLGVPVVTDFKPGASTAIGALDVQRSPADGHTLLFTNPLTHAQNPHLRAQLTYDPRLFTPIFQLVDAPNVLTAHPSVPANTVRELVAFAKVNPGKLTFASISPGSSSHLLGELLMQKTGIVLVHVPYKGAGDANRDLWGGQVNFLFDGMGSAIPGIKAKRVKPLAIAAKQRNPALPDVPTFDEEGIAGVDLAGYVGFFGPAGMPQAIVARLNAEMQKAMDTPAMTELILRGGNSPAGGPPAKFAKLVSEQSEAWGAVIRKLGLKLE